jgi:hypothetical protein
MVSPCDIPLACCINAAIVNATGTQGLCGRIYKVLHFRWRWRRFCRSCRSVSNICITIFLPSLIESIPGHPFDLTKTRLQTAPPGTYKGAVDVIKKTLARDGITGYVWWLRWTQSVVTTCFQIIQRHGSSTARRYPHFCCFFLGNFRIVELKEHSFNDTNLRVMIPQKNLFML